MDGAEGYDLRSSMTLVTNSEMVANEKEKKNNQLGTGAKCNIPAVISPLSSLHRHRWSYVGGSGTYFRLQQRVLTGML